MREALSLIKGFKEFPELNAGAGAGLQRQLLDAVLVDPDSWWADQLNALLRFAKESPIWATADEAVLQAALTRYRVSGVDDELFNCSDIDQYETLRDELTVLGESLGVPFARELEKLEERIAELERPEPEYGGGGGLGRSFEPTSGGAADSDAAIREVFGALLE